MQPDGTLTPKEKAEAERLKKEYLSALQGAFRNAHRNRKSEEELIKKMYSAKGDNRVDSFLRGAEKRFKNRIELLNKYLASIEHRTLFSIYSNRDVLEKHMLGEFKGYIESEPRYKGGKSDLIPLFIILIGLCLFILSKDTTIPLIVVFAAMAIWLVFFSKHSKERKLVSV